jgi:hypothetical protein
MATDAEAPLLPRYRRLLTFGAVLDETINLYRRSWRFMAALSVLYCLPGLAFVVLGALFGLGAVAVPDVLRDPSRLDPAAEADLARIGIAVLGLVAVSVPLFGLLLLVWGGAVACATNRLARGQAVTVWSALGAGLRRLPALVGSALAYVFALLGLLLVQVPLFAVGLFGLVSGPITLILLAIWALRPGARRPWFKWLLILVAPFGLVFYYQARWALFGQAVVLERTSPLRALRRSSALTSGHWFRVAGILLVVSVILYILIIVPSSLVSLILQAVVAVAPSFSQPGVVLAFDNAGGLLGQLLFSAISPIAFTLAFLDLRNRREGVDLAERVALLEGAGTAG